MVLKQIANETPKELKLSALQIGCLEFFLENSILTTEVQNFDLLQINAYRTNSVKFKKKHNARLNPYASSKPTNDKTLSLFLPVQ